MSGRNAQKELECYFLFYVRLLSAQQLSGRYMPSQCSPTSLKSELTARNNLMYRNELEDSVFMGHGAASRKSRYLCFATTYCPPLG